MRIVYLSWPAHEISGGIKASFQHVQLLLEAGIDAAVATPDGKPPGWFVSTAPVLTLEDIRDGDVLVFPENHLAMLQAMAPRSNPKIVFCQNCSLIFRGVVPGNSYSTFGVTHLLCPSQQVMQYGRQRFPDLKLGYAPFYLDLSLFAPSPARKLRIAAVPRKRLVEYGAILDMFRAVYPRFGQIEWVYLEDATEAQVAQVLSESAVFLSLARLEAHGMTKLEAMACGCIVAGFTGVVGGSDSSTAANGFWAPEDDIVTCVDQLAAAVQLAVDGGPAYLAMLEAGRKSAWVYRREEAARLLVDFWRGALAELVRAPVG